MASFIHLADKRHEPLIVRNGIGKGKGREGVYAVPVLPQFELTHQWARELRRRGIRSFVCVQFRIPDDEVVSVGRFKIEKLTTTASEAVAAFMEHTDGMGLEVIVPRRILPSEIVRVYPAPRITGWRYSPEAKGKPPYCRCKFCHRGEIRAQSLIRED